MKQIALYSILGKPVLAYAGITALTLFLTTALIPVWNKKMEKKISFVWHPRLAKIAIAFGIFHAMMAASLFF